MFASLEPKQPPMPPSSPLLRTFVTRMRKALARYKGLLIPLSHRPKALPNQSPQYPVPSRGLRILIAPSGFKECLEPDEVADCIEEGVRHAIGAGSGYDSGAVDTVIRKVPLHDGGEGFCRALVARHGGEIRPVRVTGPDRRPVDAYFGLFPGDLKGETTAVLDMAAAAGLRLVPRDSRDPTTTTTYGVGELIRAALDTGCTRLIIGCGDSGTSDAGAGMLQALGVSLLDKNGCELEKAGGGGSLSELAAISLVDIHPRLRRKGKQRVRIEAVCNVKNVLGGPSGVARVYGPQKGATQEQVEILSRALERFAEVAAPIVGIGGGKDLSRVPGGGASGGLGAGLLVLGARLRARADAADEYFGLRSLFDEEGPWDLVVTAEGSLDAQSARGKMTSEIAHRARDRGAAVLVLAGTVGPGAESIYKSGVGAFLSILDHPLLLEEAIGGARELLRDGAERAMRTIQLGMSLRQQPMLPSSRLSLPLQVM